MKSMIPLALVSVAILAAGAPPAAQAGQYVDPTEAMLQHALMGIAREKTGGKNVTFTGVKGWMTVPDDEVAAAMIITFCGKMTYADARTGQRVSKERFFTAETIPGPQSADQSPHALFGRESGSPAEFQTTWNELCRGGPLPIVAAIWRG